METEADTPSLTGDRFFSELPQAAKSSFAIQTIEEIRAERDDWRRSYRRLLKLCLCVVMASYVLMFTAHLPPTLNTIILIAISLLASSLAVLFFSGRRFREEVDGLR